MNKKTGESTKTIGIHTISNFDMSHPEPMLLERKIEQCIIERQQIINKYFKIISGVKNFSEMDKINKNLKDDLTSHFYKFQELKNLLNRYIVDQKVLHNLITTAGRTVEAERLANITTYTGIINYGALGSGTTTPTNADTTLETEVFRKVVADASNVNNVAYIDFYYSKADTNGTYEEFGTFIDGTGTVDTGQMYTHALTGGWVKPSTQAMNVACQYTKS